MESTEKNEQKILMKKQDGEENIFFVSQQIKPHIDYKYRYESEGGKSQATEVSFRTFRYVFGKENKIDVWNKFWVEYRLTASERFFNLYKISIINQKGIKLELINLGISKTKTFIFGNSKLISQEILFDQSDAFEIQNMETSKITRTIPLCLKNFAKNSFAESNLIINEFSEEQISNAFSGREQKPPQQLDNVRYLYQKCCEKMKHNPNFKKQLKLIKQTHFKVPRLSELIIDDCMMKLRRSEQKVEQYKREVSGQNKNREQKLQIICSLKLLLKDKEDQLILYKQRVEELLNEQTNLEENLTIIRQEVIQNQEQRQRDKIKINELKEIVQHQQDEISRYDDLRLQLEEFYRNKQSEISKLTFKAEICFTETDKTLQYIEDLIQANRGSKKLSQIEFEKLLQMLNISVIQNHKKIVTVLHQIKRENYLELSQ